MSRDRDQQLDRALKQQLRAINTPVGDHLDAETLAAWADGALDASAIASIETHVSSCPRCQSIAGVMARSAPVVAAPRRAFRIPAFWIPIAAGAAAVTIWMVVPQQRELATAPPTPPPAVIAESTPPPAQSAPAATENRPAEVARDATAQRLAKDREPAREDRRERGSFAENKPPEPSPKLEDRDLKETADSIERVQQKGGLAPAAAAPAAPPPPSAPAAALGNLQRSTRLAGPVEIVSPDPARRWRAAATGIERSEDGGRTWLAVRPAAGEAITGGIAPSGSICWLIGRSGIVLLSVDGVTFARVPVPEAIDLSSISATDARTATVTTVDGRRFVTDDSGRTWRAI